jgi:HlyD family secretion protein
MIRISKKWIVLGSVGLVIAIGAAASFRGKEPAVTYDTAVVDRGAVVDEVSATGSIAPSSKIDLEAEASGKVTRIAVEEGAQVAAGDVILEIDMKDIDTKVTAQAAALASARAKLAELEAGATVQEIALAERAVDTAESRLAAAKSAEADTMTSLSNAQKKLQNTAAKADALMDSKVTAFVSQMDDAMIKSDDAVTRLTQPLYTTEDLLSFTSTSSQAKTLGEGTRLAAKSAVSSIKAAVAIAKANSAPATLDAQYAVVGPKLATVIEHLEASVDVLNYSADLSAATLATYKTNVSTALANVSTAVTLLQAANADLDLQEKLNETELTSADIAVAEAEAQLNSAVRNVGTNESALAEAQASLDLKRAGARPETISAQRAAVSAESAKLSGLQNEKDKHRVVAPVEGTVTLIAVEVGETLQPGVQAATMNAKGSLEIISNISEIDIARVKIGDVVDITLDAFSASEHWNGEVIAVQPAETVVDNVIFYETRVRIGQEDARLRSGMTANIDITTMRRDPVLRIPTRALREDGDRTYVQLLREGNVVEERDVTVGLHTIDLVEIVDGVNEGDTVVTATR